MGVAAIGPMSLKEDRFSRLEQIEWWDQERIRSAKILVIGAGALGNEIIKNLALLGVGSLVVADLDIVESSNLSRSVFFRPSDVGEPKAICVARGAREIYPDLNVQSVVGNIMTELGYAYFRWADIVLGALDNREARVFLNSACAKVGRPWIDGGIDVFQGIVRGFYPSRTACYECTMSETDWNLINKRRSCSLLAQRAMMQRGVPTTPAIASIIGAIQVQEAVKYLHGLDALFGRGFFYNGASHDSYTINYQVNPDCGWHEQPVQIIPAKHLQWDSPLQEIWEFGSRLLGGGDELSLGREILESLHCVSCQKTEKHLAKVDGLKEKEILCPFCGVERSPRFIHSIRCDDPLIKHSIREIGLPKWDILWMRKGTESIGIQIDGDNPF